MSPTKRFYCEGGVAGGRAELTGQEAQHALRVVRLRVGDEAVLFDGTGREFRARLAEAGRKAAVFDILSEQERDCELPARIAVASAVPKGRRADFLVEKLCELGAAAWMPLWCERAVVDPRVRWKNHEARWRRIAVEAAKQCGRNRVMEIAAPREWGHLLAESGRFAGKWLCSPGGKAAEFPSCASGELLVAVGPEGGFTDDEEDSAEEAGFRPLALAPTVLRVETAAIVALARLAGHLAAPRP